MPSYNVALKNTFCEALDSFNSGTLELRDASNNVLCSITLPAAAFATPASGSVAKSGTWQGIGASVAGTGTACTNFRMVGAGGQEMTGTAGATATEMILSNDISGLDDDVIVEGNIVTVTAFTFTQG